MESMGLDRSAWNSVARLLPRTLLLHLCTRVASNRWKAAGGMVCMAAASAPAQSSLAASASARAAMPKVPFLMHRQSATIIARNPRWVICDLLKPSGTDRQVVGLRGGREGGRGMSRNYFASQYDSGYRPKALGNWEEPDKSKVGGPALNSQKRAGQYRNDNPAALSKAEGGNEGFTFRQAPTAQRRRRCPPLSLAGGAPRCCSSSPEDRRRAHHPHREREGERDWNRLST